MNKTIVLVIGVFALWPFSFAAESDMVWNGSVALKNNYVFSNGVEIDNNPVVQFWVNGQFPSGVYLDFWSNVPTESGNPNQTGELDWTVGYIHKFQSGKLNVFLSYFDVQFPDLFEGSGDVWGPKIHWLNDRYYAEVTHYTVDNFRDGYLIGTGTYYSFGRGWSLTGKLNLGDGPYQREKIVVGKIHLSHNQPKRFFNNISFELSEPLYKENSDDSRGFAWTLALEKSFFK